MSVKLLKDLNFTEIINGTKVVEEMTKLNVVEPKESIEENKKDEEEW